MTLSEMGSESADQSASRGSDVQPSSDAASAEHSSMTPPQMGSESAGQSSIRAASQGLDAAQAQQDDRMDAAPEQAVAAAQGFQSDGDAGIAEAPDQHELAEYNLFHDGVKPGAT